MSQFVESLKRLYNAGKISREKLEELLAAGKITREEFDYITGESV